jgi:hypothetical protein
MPQQQNSTPADRNADALPVQQAHVRVKEFQHVDSIMPVKDQVVSRLVAFHALSLGRTKIMHGNLSKLATVALVAAIGIGVPALGKSPHSGKGKTVASLSTREAKAQRQRALDARALSAYGSVRAPTFAVPNPNHPAFTGGGSTGYNANLYVY